MTNNLLVKVKVVFEWLFWILSKYFQLKGQQFVSIIFEMASRMLGLSHKALA